jgi:hypothetical protein
MNVPEPPFFSHQSRTRSCKRSRYTPAVTVVECLVNVEDVERGRRKGKPIALRRIEWN